MQRGLETLYRVDTGVEVGDFVIDEVMRDALAPQRRPHEQLLVVEDTGEVALALFVHPAVLTSLDSGIGRHNLGDVLLALEGVSHFVYAIHRARSEHTVSQLELELQAEVDKYLVSLLVRWNQSGEPPADLRTRLFDRVSFAGDLSREERERYELANSAASSYAASLEQRFLRTRAVEDMLSEARRFYRKGLAEKLEHITQLAA